MPSPTTHHPTRPPAIEPVRSVVSPLLPVLLPLVIAAIVLGAVFARYFPPADAGAPILRFTDVTAESGVRFQHQQGGTEAPTTLGGTVVVLDYNNDGVPDLFLVNGAPWPWEETLDKRLTRSSALLRNDGQGRFTDVTSSAGLNGELQGMAATAGDFDNDGLVDLFITCIGPNHLFRNLGQGRFEDITERAGVGGDDNTWSTGATWIDYDHDGWLDLIVLPYARWPHEVGLGQAFAIADIGRSYGAPTGFVSAFPSVYRNLGEGRFVLVPDAAGLRDIDADTGRPTTFPLALTPLDANDDGRLDLLIAYHNSASVLFINEANGSFTKQAPGRGSRQEGSSASIASASLYPSASLDARTQLLPLLSSLDASAREPRYLDLNAKLGVAAADFDLDGRIELFSGQAAAELQLNKFEAGRDFARSPAVLWRQGNAWTATDAWPQAVTARGIALADFDGDGDDDVIIAQNNDRPVLLRNDQRASLPWLRLRLIATRSQPEAGGARVEVHTPRRILTQTVAPALGFMAQSDSVLTFGLGEDARVRKILIRWPSGQVQEVKPDALNQTLVIREP